MLVVKMWKELKTLRNGFPQIVLRFPDMRFTMVDSIAAESGKVASTFVVEGTHEKEFRGIPIPIRNLKPSV